MSSTPPGPPSPPPDSPYTPPAATPGPPAPSERLPWEERDRLGFLEALVQTIRLLVTNPSDGFARLRQDGDITSPVLFAVLLSFVSLLFSQMWQFFLSSTYRNLFSGVEGVEEVFADPSFGALLATLVLGPIFFIVFLFIATGILHLCLMLVGGTEHSPTGFEGTLKVYAYSQVAGLAMAVPLVGGIVYAIWALVLEVVGFATVHRTTQGRALAGVLIPVAVCCLCALLSAVFFGAMMSAMFAGFGQGSMQ